MSWVGPDLGSGRGGGQAPALPKNSARNDTWGDEAVLAGRRGGADKSVCPTEGFYFSLGGADTPVCAAKVRRGTHKPRSSPLPDSFACHPERSEGSQSLPVASIEIPRPQGNQGLGMTRQGVAATKAPFAFVVGLCLEQAGVEAGLGLHRERGTRCGSRPR